MMRHSLTALVCVAIVLPMQTRAQEPTLPQVLARAGVYVLKLHTQLSGIVAEETYEQRARETQRRTNGPASGRRVLAFARKRDSALSRADKELRTALISRDNGVLLPRAM